MTNHHLVGHEGDAACHDGHDHEEGGGVEQEALPELLGLDAQQQRSGDGYEQPQHGVDMAGAHIDVLDAVLGESQYEVVGDGANEQRDDGEFPLGHVALQSGVAVQQPQHEQGDEPEAGDDDNLGGTDEQHQGVDRPAGHAVDVFRVLLVRGARFEGVVQFPQAVLFAQVHLGLAPVVSRVGHDVEEGRLSVQEDVPLQVLVARLSVVVVFLQSQESLLVVGAVGHDFGAVVGVHLQHFRGVVNARVAQCLADGVEHEGCRQRVLEGNADDFPLQH